MSSSSIKKNQFSSIWAIDKTLSGATTPGQSRPGSEGNKEVLRIPQSSSNTWSLSIRLFRVISGHSLGESYLFAEM